MGKESFSLPLASLASCGVGGRVVIPSVSLYDWIHPVLYIASSFGLVEI